MKLFKRKEKEYVLSGLKTVKGTIIGELVSFGSGWIMTAAHNFQDEDRDDETTHSLINQSEFSFFVGGETRTFGRHERTAFIHHLQPGEGAHPEDKDIAMVKLGLQHEYRRSPSEYEEIWEKQEKQMLNGLEIFAKLEFPDVQVGQSVQAVRFGGNTNDKKIVTSRVTNISDGSESVPVPLLHLHNPGGGTVECPFPSGSSGCPILIESGGEFILVGLHFSGDADETNPNGEAEALPWSQEIHQYIHEGVGLIVDIDGYMANKKKAATSTGEPQIQANEEANQYRASLIQTAQKNNLR